eukprot:CAMPEP_0202854164 /NCGR_PEP_ID=MMETSP1389-20130828/90860_1 /ASSEMBLY_ACC=CAM_ASM_000865 /TAXON_ID=302021 /ORGANISM="Rhodomonas sp., Strain CCMP768" /LENGTH=577 /DNA_ID=CAMNT_0049532745 /DNA_START=76 /DNA_END=1810 /DNA_ORIENTATION=+
MDGATHLAKIEGIVPTADQMKPDTGNTSEDIAVELTDFDFRFQTGMPLVLNKVSLRVPAGTRTLLIGANGAGKSSMLRVIAGRHFHSPSKVRVLGRPAFHDTSLSRDVAHLGERWGYENFGDVSVKELVASVEDADPQRVEELMEVLEVEWEWKIYRLSDGQRRRVQLLLGLARRNRVLLLDEVTTDLDLVARQNLLQFLKDESDLRGVTIIYATHIFDGLDKWATDLVYITQGTVTVNNKLSELEELNALKAKNTPAPLFRLVEGWLRKEFEERQRRRKANPSTTDDKEGYGDAERTMFTGFARGSVIPTPNLNANDTTEQREAARLAAMTPAQRERYEWQMQHQGTATVTNDNGDSCFSAGRLGFNKSNPLPAASERFKFKFSAWRVGGTEPVRSGRRANWGKLEKSWHSKPSVGAMDPGETFSASVTGRGAFKFPARRFRATSELLLAESKSLRLRKKKATSGRCSIRAPPPLPTITETAVSRPGGSGSTSQILCRRRSEGFKFKFKFSAWRVSGTEPVRSGRRANSADSGKREKFWHSEPTVGAMDPGETLSASVTGRGALKLPARRFRAVAG